MQTCHRKLLPLIALIFIAIIPLTRAADPAPKISPTLAQDLTTIEVPLLPNYASSKHPRLLFSPEDRPALQQKAKAGPELWNPVLASAKRLGPAPAADIIKSGAKYWQIERVESGALAYFITGDKAHLESTLRWMIPHCQEKIWGTGFRDNLDLQASWYLYHLSLAYDILHDDIPEADQKIIKDGLASHAKAIFDSFDPADPKAKFNFDQNHTYIPAVALATASLALLGEVPEAKDWLKRAYGILQRCRYVMGDDGYYYEGYGYWMYAMHWHVRYADLISRATGQNALDLPALKDNWKFALYLMLPGNPGAFDIHDTNKWTGNDRPAIKANNTAIYWDIASALQRGGGDAMIAGENREVADFYHSRSPDNDYPASSFLWYAPDIAPTPLEKIKPYNYFGDHDVITWRSGWDANATCLLFRCGPPEGHAALEKLNLMKDWTLNAGHVHPDIGAFYLFAKGTNLAVATGYTAEKWTRDHNTLLIDNKGQANDGSYWNDRGIPYEKLNEARITRTYLSENYAFATGQFGPVYTQTPDVNLTRSLLITKRYLLVIDDMAAPAEHQLTWLVHADAEFKPDAKAFIAKLPKASLALFPLAPTDMIATPEPTKVMAGTGPGNATETQRGYHLTLTMKTPAKSARLVNLLVPLAPDETPPTIQSTALIGNSISLQLKWPDGQTESMTINLQWQKGLDTTPPDPGPAAFTTQ